MSVNKAEVNVLEGAPDWPARLGHPRYSYLLAGLVPQARPKTYSDAAHGFLFQHHAEFAADAEAFH